MPAPASPDNRHSIIRARPSITRRIPAQLQCTEIPLTISFESVTSRCPTPPADCRALATRLRGAWHLFRTSKKKGQDATKEWMLVKRNDGWASDTRALPQESIYSGLTVEELAAGPDRGREVDDLLDDLGARRHDVRGEDVELMLATVAEAPFSRPGWLFELKYDGYRLLAEKRDGRARLFYRSGMLATDVFPEIARAIPRCPSEPGSSTAR